MQTTLNPRRRPGPRSRTQMFIGRGMRRPRARLIITSLAAIGLFLTVAPGTASASTVVYTVKDHQTGRCLDSNSNGNVYTLPCNGGNYQYWYLPDTTPQTIDYQTGRCLDSNSNGNVYTLPCNGGNYQNWYFDPFNGTIVDFQTGRCLDSNYNGNVYTLPCNGGNYQFWDLYQVILPGT